MIMEMCNPIEMRNSLEMVEMLRKAGIQFIPVPVIEPEDKNKLVQEMDRRLEMITRMAEGKDPMQEGYTIPLFRLAVPDPRGKNNVWEVTMPDGNRFRYTWGMMVPFSDNKSGAPGSADNGKEG